MIFSRRLREVSLVRFPIAAGTSTILLSLRARYVRFLMCNNPLGILGRAGESLARQWEWIITGYSLITIAMIGAYFLR